MLAEALRLVSLGIPVHWLHPREKRPIDFGWAGSPETPGLEDDYRHGMNLGVKLGWELPNGLHLGVLDCDASSPDTADAMLMALDALAPGAVWSWPQVKSGRPHGGAHLYFASFGPITGGKIAGDRESLGWEIVVMGQGRQVVAPPSIHPSGTTYQWVIPLNHLDDLPIWEAPETIKRPMLEGPLIYDFVAVDILTLNLHPDLVDRIVNGVTGDRSLALYNTTVALLRHGLPDSVIVSILTDAYAHKLAETCFDHIHSTDRRRAAEWFQKYTLHQAKQDTPTLLVMGTASPISSTPPNWFAALKRRDNGVIIPDYQNFRWMCENAFPQPMIQRNEFSQKHIWMIDTDWSEPGQERSSGLEDALQMRDFLLTKYGVTFASAVVEEYLLMTAEQHAFHPLKDYLTGLVWDGMPRLDTMLEHYLGAYGNSTYLADVGRKWMLGAVTRVFKPGSKFDFMVVLEGAQGIGKSTFGATLAGRDWYLEGLPPMQDKDAALNLQGAWICEVAELASIYRSSQENVKAFLSRDIDRVRPPYGRRRIDLARTTVFLGTTNSQVYLQDPTGARRFWPVPVTQNKFADLIRDRDQLWAEAVAIFDQNTEQLYLTDPVSICALSDLHRNRRPENLDNDIFALIQDWWLKKTPAEQAQPFKQRDLFHGPLVSIMRSRSTEMGVANALRQLGFDKNTQNDWHKL